MMCGIPDWWDEWVVIDREKGKNEYGGYTWLKEDAPEEIKKEFKEFMEEVTDGS